MAYFRCDTSKITAEQLAAISGIQGLFEEQCQKCIVISLDPMTFDVQSASLTEMMRERLLRARVGHAIEGYVGKFEGNSLVIQKAKADKPIVRRRKRASKGDSDIQPGAGQEVAKSSAA